MKRKDDGLINHSESMFKKRDFFLLVLDPLPPLAIA